MLQQLQPLPAPVIDFYVVSKGDEAEAQALKLAQKLRHEGFSAELDLSGSGFKKQFARADRSGAIACLIIGEEEAANFSVKLKWMRSKEQSAISQFELIAATGDLRYQLDSYKTQLV